MYKLAKIDRRANSSFKKKIYIYIYYLIYIYIFIYKYSPGRARVCSFFFWRTLYIFLFHSLARSVFDWLRFQSGSLWDSSFSNFCLWYIRCLDTTRTLISLHHFVSLFFFTFYLIKGEMRIFVRFSFFPSFDKSYVLFGSDSLPILLFYSLVKKYPKKRFRATF